LVFASNNILAADIFALAFLKYLREEKTSMFSKFLEKSLLFSARRYHDFSGMVYLNRFISYGIEVGLGHAGVDVHWGDVSSELSDELMKFL
jgi:hypothetical protein